MPLTNSEWNDGRTNNTIEARIMSYLRTHSDTAFTAGEIAAGIGKSKDVSDLVVAAVAVAFKFPIPDEVRTALDKLVKAGDVEKKEIHTGQYTKETFYRCR